MTPSASAVSLSATFLGVACVGSPAVSPAPEPPAAPSPADETAVRLPPGATLPEVLSAIAAADLDPDIHGADCVLLWGQIQPGPGLGALRIRTEGHGELTGYVACDDSAIDGALPAPSGVLVGFGDDGSLVLAHGSDLSESVVFDAEYRDSVAGDPRVRQSYVMIAVRGDERIAASLALPTLAGITDTFGAAVLPIGQRSR